VIFKDEDRVVMSWLCNYRFCKLKTQRHDFQLKMHHKAFDSQAVPEPTDGGIHSTPQTNWI